MVLRLAALAIDLFIDGARRTGIEAGGDEACVHTVGSSFDAGDDAFNAIPTRGAVVEFLEARSLSESRAAAKRAAVLCSSVSIWRRNVVVVATPRA